jgi:hypothetical protein
MRLVLPFLLATVPVLAIISPFAYAQTCSCGPDYCQGDARYPGLLAKKKASLSASYPRKSGLPCVAKAESLARQSVVSSDSATFR